MHLSATELFSSFIFWFQRNSTISEPCFRTIDCYTMRNLRASKMAVHKPTGDVTVGSPRVEQRPAGVMSRTGLINQKVRKLPSLQTDIVERRAAKEAHIPLQLLKEINWFKLAFIGEKLIQVHAHVFFFQHLLVELDTFDITTLWGENFDFFPPVALKTSSCN